MVTIPKTGDRNKADGQGKGENTAIRRHRRLFATSVFVALLVAALALLAGPALHTSAHAANETEGYVYALNNDLSGSNSITVFARREDGSLKLSGTTSIGGLGSLAAFADGTQGSLILTHDEGERLFAADAGSNQISVVNVHDGHLSPMGVFSSGGTGPISLTYRDGLLYVLNAANGTTQSANVAGFHVDSKGNLHPISGATRPLTQARPNPAEILIDPSGHFVLVTEKLTNLIDVYRIADNGGLSGPTTFSSVGVYPFGMAFNPARPQEFIVDDGFGTNNPPTNGAVTAYNLTHGNVHLVNGPVSDFQVAPCWMVVTQNGRYAYTTDADSHAISGYAIGKGGAISLLTANGATAETPSDTFPLEEGLSDDSHYLYTLDSRLLLPTPGPATISGFAIHHDGSLTSVVDPTQITLPFSTIGLAAE